MKAGDQFIKKIKKIPIQTNREQFIEKYLQSIGKEMATLFLVEHCGILLFTKSTLLKDLLVETYERQSTSFEYLDLDSLPWLTKKDNQQNIITLSDLKSLEDKDPLKQSLISLFGSPLRSGVIRPIYFNQAVIGSIILLYEYTIHLFTPYEIEILKQASDHLTYALEKLVRKKMMEAAKKILFHINEYHQLLRQDEAQNKNPNIIAEVLQKVFDLKSVYIMIKHGSRGNRWYQANIKESGAIESDSGTFPDSTFEFMLEEVKKDCPDFIDVPIKNNGSVIGKLFVDYGRRE
ncbi:MAG: GAF domain-containing protein, partial [Desulfobacterales bacterium]